MPYLNLDKRKRYRYYQLKQNKRKGTWGGCARMDDHSHTSTSHFQNLNLDHPQTNSHLPAHISLSIHPHTLNPNIHTASFPILQSVPVPHNPWLGLSRAHQPKRCESTDERDTKALGRRGRGRHRLRPNRLYRQQYRKIRPPNRRTHQLDVGLALAEPVGRQLTDRFRIYF